MVFRNREQAGLQLEWALRNAMPQNALLLALTAGSTVVAFEIAKRLGLPIQMLGPQTEDDFTDRDLMLVDDGSTSAAMIRAVSETLAKTQPASIGFASPICLEDALDEALTHFEPVVCLEKLPERVQVSAWYDEFPEVSDEHANELIKESQYLAKHHHAA
jgi:predicted phosphoribosyltransferase